LEAVLRDSGGVWRVPDRNLRKNWREEDVVKGRKKRV